MAPTFAWKAGILKFLEKPIDFGKKFQGFPIFGPHKTWRGAILGVLAAVVMAFFQRKLWQFHFFQKLSFFNYEEINIFLLGFLLGFGTILGDCISSFFKRRRKIAPGSPWIPFDQISFVIGAFFLTFPFFKIQILAWFWILFLSFFLHILGNLVGFWLGINKSRL
jgi:CDP-2,3-bis-(O-geranylgeranyl)-sn-glycerol synthase